MFVYVGYISDVRMGVPRMARVGGFQQTNAVLPTRYGLVRAVESGGGLDPRLITVYLDRPVAIVIVRREVLATSEHTMTVRLRLRSQDSLEIDLPERSEVLVGNCRNRNYAVISCAVQRPMYFGSHISCKLRGRVPSLALFGICCLWFLLEIPNRHDARVD